jgi:hypothetical protein
VAARRAEGMMDPIQIFVALIVGGVILVALADFGVLTRI